MKITKKVVDSVTFLPHSEGKDKLQHFVWDSELKGFGLRITPNGKKSFVVRYLQGHKDRRMTLGVYGKITTEQARSLALRQLAQVAEGNDPAGEKKKHRIKGKTVADLAESYYQYHVLVYNKSKETKKKFRAYIDQYVLPKFGHASIKEIDRDMIKAILDTALKGKKQHKTTFNRVREMLSKMMNYGIDEGWVHQNPVSRIKPFKLIPRDKWIKPNELQTIFKAVNNYPNPYARAYFFLLLFTACRRSELQLAQWKDIDLKNKIWTIPDTKNDQTHEIPLNDGALKFMKEIQQKNNPYLIAGDTSKNYYNSLDKTWERILIKAEMEGSYRIHDLRRTIASYLAQHSVSRERIAQALNHKDGTVTGIYARLSWNEKVDTFNVIDQLLRDIFKDL